MLGLKEQEPAEPRTRATVWPQNPPPGCGGGGRGSRPGAKVEQMVKRREWEGGLAAAKSRAFAGTITMETVEGRKDPAPHFLGPENEFFSLLRRVPLELQVPAVAGLLHLLRKSCIRRGPPGLVVLRQWAEVAFRPLVDMAPTFAPSGARQTLPVVISAPRPFPLLTI